MAVFVSRNESSDRLLGGTDAKSRSIVTTIACYSEQRGIYVNYIINLTPAPNLFIVSSAAIGPNSDTV